MTRFVVPLLLVLLLPVVIALTVLAEGRDGSDASWMWLEDARTRLTEPVDLPVAEALAKRAVAQGGARGRKAAYGSFILGNVAFVRSRVTEEQALQPGADPKLLQRAIADAEDALAHWRLAAASRADWPRARRNVERGILLLERLRERASDRTKRKIRPRPKDVPPPPPTPDEPPPPKPDPSRDPTIDLRKDDLPAQKVLGLLELLQEKERKKRDVRRRHRRTRTAGVERDW